MSSAASPSAVTSVIHRALTERHAVWRTVSAPGAGPLRTLANDELAGVAEAPDPGSHLLAVAVDPVRQEVACWRGTLARVDVPWAYFVAGPQGTTPDFTDVEPVDYGNGLRLGGLEVSVADLVNAWGTPSA